MKHEAYNEMNTHEPNHRLKNWNITNTVMFLPACLSHILCLPSPQSKHDIQFYVYHP